MRFLFIPMVTLFVAWSVSSCGGSGAKTFCDTTGCNSAPITFWETHVDSPFVKLTMTGCRPDSITWSHLGLATNRKQGFVELVGKEVTINKNFVSCFFKDTSYAWLKFNDCITGRGYLVKLPYSKSDNWNIYTSALNSFDPKFSVEEGYIAYYDETFMYAQNMATGKWDRMLLNDTKLDIKHDDVHSTFDSVHITHDRIFANIMINGKLVAKDKKVDLNAAP